MTPRLPRPSGRATVAALRRAGFVQLSQRGSHVKMRHPDTRRTAIVPLHAELAVGTLSSILRQTALTPEAFIELLQD